MKADLRYLCGALGMRCNSLCDELCDDTRDLQIQQLIPVPVPAHRDSKAPNVHVSVAGRCGFSA